MPAFEDPEYRHRIERTKERMRDRGIDMLLVSSPENINYLCGYEGWSFYLPQILAIDAEHPDPLLIVRDMDRACARFTSFLSEDDVIGYEERWVGQHEDHVMRHIGSMLTSRGSPNSTVGVEMDAAYFTARCFAELREGMPRSRFVDATLLVNWIRIVKSAGEIRYLREAAELADSAMIRARDTLAPGVRGCDAAAAIVGQLIAGTAAFGGDIPTVVFLMPGERAAAPHLTWGDEPLPPDVPVSIELGGCRYRYHAGLARTFYLGSPPPELDELARVVVEGMGAALGTVRPGVTCEDVEHAWHGVIASAGYEKRSRIGYSIGLGFQPSWVEQTASLQRGDLTVLEPNMTFHMICGMWEGERNVELSETIRVTEEGVEVLTSFPRELIGLPA